MSQGSVGGRSLDASKIEAAYVGFFTTFQNRLKVAPSIYKRISTVVETENVLDTQIWLSNAPRMRRWIGPKALQKFRGQSHPIVNEPYEASVEVPKHDIMNDRYGLFGRQINSLGDAYDYALDELVIGMLCAGVQGTACGATYDGQNLIDTDHTALQTGGTSQSNKVTGALSATTYATAWQRYLEIKDENGQPINMPSSKMILLVGPANRSAARTILEQKTGANGAENIDANSATLVVHPRITAGTITVKGVSVTLTGLEWFLIPEGSSAVIVQIKRSVEFLSVEDGEFVFRTGKFLYGTEAEFGAAYGLWQEVVGGPGS